ncbi:hypothetical protein H4R27_006094 [Coemansia aciculifera]|nr:hypothetical protein H4R27_006094 [Coemansia aciculifera]
MLRKYKVFEPGRHLRLQVIKVKYRGGYDSESFTSPAEALQYMYNIGSGAAVHSDEYKSFQMPLLWVCHNFCAPVHQRFCRRYKLSLKNDQDRAETRLYSWPTRDRELGYATNLLAKEFRVELDIASVYSGKAIRLLSDAPYEGCAFLLVRKQLVSAYGEDWDCIGKALGVLPSRAQHSWIKLENVGDRSAWSLDETRQFQRLIDSGVKAKEAAKLLGTRSHWAFKDKTKTVKPLATRQQDDTLSGSHWAAADDETLLKMIDGSAMNTAAKWEQAGKALGRSAIAYKCQFTVVNHSRKHIQATVDIQSLVTSKVQRQFESSSIVDWSQVSQATGLRMRECLELSQCDVGKASWRYDPDLFLQDMADRMTGFIEKHYPAPTPMNYQAVSNYMWIITEDCIRIYGMLQGKFK